MEQYRLTFILFHKLHRVDKSLFCLFFKVYLFKLFYFKRVIMYKIIFNGTVESIYTYETYEEAVKDKIAYENHQGNNSVEIKKINSID